MNKSFIVDSSSIDMRIDRWIKNTIGNVPQSLIERSLRNGKIKLNNKKVKSSTKLSKSDKIYFYNFQFIERKKEKYKFKPSNQIIKENEEDIIDNNDNFIVINKKSGIAVQGGTKSKKNIIDIFSNSKYFQNTKPYSVHRLDKDTSGVFIIAKNRETAKLLTSLFRLRKIHKTYLAICNGEFNQSKGEWRGELSRYDGKRKITEKAITKFKVIDKNNNSTLIQMHPVTGRKHQLRKQLSELDHPIYGDSKYTFNKSFKRLNKQLMLHSYELKFIINNQKFTYRALLPDYFKKLLITKKLKFLGN
jgi:23S rRNA pseudouridine955/2504/2580 synthase